MGDLGNYLPALIRGAILTIILCAVSGSIGTIIGLVFGVGRSSPLLPVRFISAIYPNFIRGIPVLVLLFFIYFALPLLFPALALDRSYVAVAGLSIYTGAYMAEIFRGSIEAIPAGQSEAAEALGMSYVQKMRHVILPQAMKIAVPPGIGFLISLVKASSLVSIIGYVDLTYAGKIASTRNQEPLTTFIIVAVLYFIISYPISLLGRWYERRLV
ncbi:MAG: amino acid ABC transporter permease [Streptosporangiales bacterium]